MNLSDYFLSVVRTAVPAGVGAVLTYLATRWGIGLDEDTSAQVTAGVTAVVIAVYYAVVRALEARWPVLGKLLGSSKKPVYTATR
jgi:hypothetical protein